MKYFKKFIIFLILGALFTNTIYAQISEEVLEDASNVLNNKINEKMGSDYGIYNITDNGNTIKVKVENTNTINAHDQAVYIIANIYLIIYSIEQENISNRDVEVNINDDIIFKTRFDIINEFLDSFESYEDFQSNASTSKALTKLIKNLEILDIRDRDEILRDELSLFDVSIYDLKINENEINIVLENNSDSESEMISQLLSMTLLAIENYPEANNINFNYVIDNSDTMLSFNMVQKDILDYYSNDITVEELIKKTEIEEKNLDEYRNVNEVNANKDNNNYTIYIAIIGALIILVIIIVIIGRNKRKSNIS